MLLTRNSLLAATIAAAVPCVPAQAAFFTYTFVFDGVGTRLSQEDNNLIPKLEALKGAKIQFGFNIVDERASSVFGADNTSTFSFSAVGQLLNFSFLPEPLQSNFVAEGSGEACLDAPSDSIPVSTSAFTQNCGSTSFVASTLRRTERFSGILRTAQVTQSEAGSDFLSIAGYVPEPSTWALMLAGFGLVAYSLRRRPQLSYAH